MTRHDDFFTRKQAAAVLKHGVLIRYPFVFASMAGKNSDEVVLFDGYAGPGRYEDGSAGSPLLAVETARNAARFRQIRCVFCEEDIDTASELHSALKAEATELKWEVLYGDVEKYAGQIVREAGEAPMLTFLDPFGVGLDFDVLTQQLLARPANIPTEVLLNINVESVWRIGGRLKDVEEGLSTAAGAEKSLRRVDRSMGGAWWRDRFREAWRPNQPGSAAEAASAVVTDFCRLVHAQTGFSSFQLPIRRRPTHPALFSLTLFYRHQVAPWKFNESASGANQDWRRACMQEDLDRVLAKPVEASLFGDAVETEQLVRDSRLAAWNVQEKQLEDEWTATIADNLERLLATQPSVPLAGNVRAVYGNTLGLARDKHVNGAWALLVDRRIAAAKPPKTRLEYAVLNRFA